LLGLLPTVLLVGWAGRGISRNYREGSEFRRRILWQNYLLLALFLIPWLLLTGWVHHQWGLHALYTCLAIYTLPSILQCLLTLRVNRNPQTLAHLTGTTCMAASFAAIGLLGWPFATFFAAMLVYNVGLLLARKAMSARGDYNLFLRAATGGLREPRTQTDSPVSPTADDLRAPGCGLFAAAVRLCSLPPTGA
jgi:hypothetical protein